MKGLSEVTHNLKKREGEEFTDNSIHLLTLFSVTATIQALRLPLCVNSLMC